MVNGLYKGRLSLRSSLNQPIPLGLKAPVNEAGTFGTILVQSGCILQPKLLKTEANSRPLLPEAKHREQDMNTWYIFWCDFGTLKAYFVPFERIGLHRNAHIIQIVTGFLFAAKGLV